MKTLGQLGRTEGTVRPAQADKEITAQSKGCMHVFGLIQGRLLAVRENPTMRP